MNQQEPRSSGVSWKEILTPEYLPRLATLAMALWLHASNSMLTATTMPTAVQDIGGLHLLSWTFALYLVGSIIAGASSSLLVARYGLRSTMVRAALVYGAGCIVCALAPSMPVVLAGRLLQGLGGGCLIALVYISQDRFFPNAMVPKIVASLSTVWMTSSFCGPMIGGAFATWGIWRGAYWAFAVQAVLLIFAVKALLPSSQGEDEADSLRIPLVRLGFLAAAIVLVSLAGAHFHPFRSALYIAFGLLALGCFIHRDHHASSMRMLPIAATQITGPVGSGLAATFLLCLCIMSFLVYGPLVLIRLYGLTPFVAGLVIMVESMAWGVAAIIFSGISPAREGLLIRCGSALVVVHIVLMALVLPAGSLLAVIAVAVMGNCGFGMMWGYIIKRIVGAAEKDEKDRAASMVAITQQAGFAIGAALCGVIANGLGLVDDAAGEVIGYIAFWLFASFVPLSVAGLLFAWRFARFPLH